MTAAGWVFMTVSLSFVLALSTFCYVRVLRSKPERPEAPNDE